jgi:hypothetical protein
MNNTRVSVKLSKDPHSVIVYYDSQDPRVSSLEDFSEQSLENMRFVYFFVVTLAVTGALILWARASQRL